MAKTAFGQNGSGGRGRTGREQVARRKELGAGAAVRVCVGVVPCAIGAVGVAVVVVVPSQAAGAVRVALCGQRAQHPLREKDTFKD